MGRHRPLRIVVLNDLLPPDSDGGLELSAMELGQALRERGHDVHWVCAEWRKSFSSERVEHSKVHRILRLADVRENPDSKLPRRLESIRATERKINIAKPNFDILSRFLYEEGPFDVALVLGILRIGLGTVRAFSESDIPVVWSVGDVSLAVHFAMPSQTRLYHAVFSTIGRKWHEAEKAVDFSHMLFTSDFVRSQLAEVGIAPGRWAIVPRSVDFEPGYTPEQKTEPPVIFIASRLTPARGVHSAIEAARLLADRRPDLKWNLRIAGDGDPSYLSELVLNAAPIADRVGFLGKISKSDVVAEMRKATIAVNPTIEVEGFGRANVEALACGDVLIASDVPAVHEVVDNRNCALLYPPGEAAVLSEQLERVLCEPQLRQELAENGVERAKDYTLNRVVSEVEGNLAEAARAVREKRAS